MTGHFCKKFYHYSKIGFSWILDSLYGALWRCSCVRL